MNSRAVSGTESIMSLEKILTIWLDCWREKNKVTTQWMEYKPSQVKRRLHGFFTLNPSKLWNLGAHGLEKIVDVETGRRESVEFSPESPVALRGTVVVCCDQKMYRETVGSQGYHRKQGFRIADIYNHLLAFSEENPRISDILAHLELDEEGETVLFRPYVSYADQIRPLSTGSIWAPPPDEPPPDELFDADGNRSLSRAREVLIQSYHMAI